MPTVSITNYENLPGAVGIVFVPAVENHVVAQLHLRLHFFDPVREVVAMATMYHLSGTVGSVHWAERNEEGQRRGIVVTVPRLVLCRARADSGYYLTFRHVHLLMVYILTQKRLDYRKTLGN